MRSIISLLLSLSFITDAAVAASVGYSGYLYSEFGAPVVGGYVVAGTFSPDTVFEGTYVDDVGDWLGGAYDNGVTAGFFSPIGNGTLTNTEGFFSSFGISSAPAGRPIWLFAFEDDSRDSFYQVLASSDDFSWQVPNQPSGHTTINAVDANMFFIGNSHPQGIELSVVPFPEPTSLVLMLLGSVTLLGKRHSCR